MSAPRLIALLLVIVEAIIYAYMLKGWAFIAIPCALAVVGAFGYYQVRLSAFRQALFALLLALPFAVVWQVWIQAEESMNVVFADNLGAVVAQYLITLQALQFYIRHERDMPRMFPFLGVFVLLFCGDLFLRQDTQKLIFFGWCFLYAVLAAYYMSTLQPAAPHRVLPRAPRRGLWTALTLCAALILGWSTARFLEYAEREMAQFFLRPLPLPIDQIGFSRIARLDSMSNIRGNEGQDAALRIFSDTMPGYIRGAAYTRYLNDVWHIEEGRVVIPPAPDWPQALQKHQAEQAFPLQDAADITAQFRIWSSERLQEVIFTPWHTTWILAREEQLERDVNGALRAPEGLHGQPYTAATGAGAPAIERRAEYLALPEGLNPDVRSLALRICAESQSDAEKVAAIAGWFQQHYEYDLGIQIPPEADPLEYFLLSDPPPAAHCEYFASGAAILLRSAGVPARYVTGFMSHERHPYGGYWLARNRDAHAWVEAFIEGEGWMIVEATPASGRPQEIDATVGALRQALDYAGFQWQQIKARIFVGGLSGLLWLLVEGLQWLLHMAVATWAGRVILGLLALAGLWEILRKWRRRRKRVPHLPLEPHVIALNRLLQQMDDRLSKEGFTRLPNETIHAFARRVEKEMETKAAAAQWYRRYAEARYHGPPPPEIVAKLAQLP